MSVTRVFVRLALAVGVLLGFLPSAGAGDEADDRKGRFVRVVTTSSIVVARFNREWSFDLLGVKPVLGLKGDPLEREAKQFLTSLLEGQRVLLLLDAVAPRGDQPRTFAGYVYLEDGRCLNEEILKQGYGRVDDAVAFSRLERFKSFEREAQELGLGLWKEVGSPSTEDSTCSHGAITYAGMCGVSVPVIIPESKVVPVYPRKARKRKIEGRVVLRAIVSSDGSVRDAVMIESPSEELTEAAIAAVRQWRYKPALKDSVPVDAYFTVVVDFRLLR